MRKTHYPHLLHGQKLAPRKDFTHPHRINEFFCQRNRILVIGASNRMDWRVLFALDL